MIQVERINGTELYINCENIQQVEKRGNTVITLMNQETLIVKNEPEEILKKIIEYKSNIINFRKS